MLSTRPSFSAAARPKRQLDVQCSASMPRRQALASLVSGMALLGAQRAQAAEGTLADLLKPMGAALDVDRDGKLSVEELRMAAQASEQQTVSRESVRREIVPRIDFNADGQVSVSEFNRAAALELPLDDEVFSVIDADRNSQVTLNELRTALGNLGSRGDAVISTAFDLAGGKTNGSLSREQVEKAFDMISFGVLGGMQS